MNQTHLKDLKSKLPSEKFWFTFLLLVITLAYYLVHVDVQNTSYSPFNRTWGFDQLVYYSLPVKIIGALIIFAFLVPSICILL